MQQTSALATDLAYAAGVIDSDGYIGVYRSTYAMRVRGDASQAVYSPRMVVKQVEPQAIDLLRGMFDGHRYAGKPTAAKGRPLIVWQIHSAACASVLEALLPHLRIKRLQAENALDLCRLNRAPRRRQFAVPEIVDGEPLVPLLDAARRAGRTSAVAYQSAHLRNIPTVRVGRRVYVPESFIDPWRARPRGAIRSPEVTAAMEACFQRAKALNRVGI